jgi:hypothetical protein
MQSTLEKLKIAKEKSDKTGRNYGNEYSIISSARL